MAIKISDYQVVKNESNLKIHKHENTKFLFDFRYDGKRYRKQYKVQASDWNKTDCIKDAKKALSKYKNEVEGGYTTTSKTTLNQLFDKFSSNFDTSKRWTKDRIGIYERYIKHIIEPKESTTLLENRKLSRVGQKQIGAIVEADIEHILADLKRNGYSPRTQKSVLEVLKPLFKYAVKNKYIQESPIVELTVKIPNQKKIVTNASDKFKMIFDGIKTYYKDNPFYQALFLFGFTGRRKSEILHIKWENIDFKNNYYWIEDTKNDDKQKYPLPDFIKEQLLLISDERTGLVFKSPVTSKALTFTERQMRQLKKHIGIPELSLHYMRNILVSALAEQGTEAIVLSGILGHKDANTINKYLSINHFKSGQIGLKKIDNVIDVEVNDE